MKKERVIEIIETEFARWEKIRNDALENHNIVEAKIASGGLMALGQVWKTVTEGKDDETDA